jgi:hypothetical protein
VTELQLKAFKLILEMASLLKDGSVMSIMNKKENDVEDYEADELRECDSSCPHFDELNLCCWQSMERHVTRKDGRELIEFRLCFNVSEGDYCHLGYKRNDGS